jgi:transposase
VLVVGDDWAEAHHDIEIEDESGRRLARGRLPEGLAGISRFHELVADHLDPDSEPSEVLVGIETDRGPWVQALVAAGYSVYPINPFQVSRYRDRHAASGAKSDPGDAHVLAEIVRLDRAHHRPLTGDSDIAEHVKAAARAHQSMIWSRQRQVNTLRSTLREFYPAALTAFGDLASADALAVLAAAPSPEQGEVLAGQVEQGFGQHPDVEIYRSQPGLGTILGARVLAEFGDNPDRYADAKGRKNYSGMSPITKASGTKRVVLARHARNRRLADALYQQAFCALSSSPGARAFYDRQRDRGATHHQALRALGNRLVGILHGCLRHHTIYNEDTAWPTLTKNEQQAA